MATPPSFPSLDPSEHPPKKPARPYATHSSRAFSRSAEKRQSVMALPSIQHLQHNFARLALDNSKPRSVAEMVGGPLSVEERKEARRKSALLRRASAQHAGELVEELEEAEDEGAAGDLLGPAPEKPEVDTRFPWEKDEGLSGPAVRSEQELRADVLQGLEAVCERWGLIAHLSLTSLSRSPTPSSRRLSRSSYSGTSSPDPSRSASPALFLSASSSAQRPTSPFSDTSAATTEDKDVPFVLDLLTTTTSAIRAVQAYVVALPSSTFSSFPSSTSSSAAPLGSSDAANRSTGDGRDDLPHLRLSTAARPRTSLALPVSVSSSSSSSSTAKGKARTAEGEEPELLAELRRRSLEVLGVLRELEGRFRLPPPNSHAGDEKENEGERAYDPAVSLAEVLDAAEKEAEEQVKGWVEVVGRVLEGASKARSGRRRRGRRSEEGGVSEEEGDEEEEVPEWAREAVEGDGLARAHALLLAHASYLPPSLSSLPPSYTSSSRSLFLHTLSSGTLLCHAYNATLRHSSPRPFGFIPASSVHAIPLEAAEGEGDGEGARSAGMVREASAASADSETGEGRGKVGGTFRRVENLRVWAAALKFRYALPLVFPSAAPLSLPSSPALSSAPPSSAPSPSENALLFDPRLVARQEEGSGWEEMLERVVEAWAGAVGREWREGFLGAAEGEGGDV
ncbi:hypothetical protein JCM8097_002712 [Rhodosporidiobolus ruineniae]